MKKFISLLLATMMLLSFATISYAADLTSIISSDTVELNASDATATVTVTFNFPDEVALLALQPEVTFDKSALTLDTFTLTGDGVTWSTTDSNLDIDYGAYLSFDDTTYTGTSPAKQYIMTLNFTVKNVATAASYAVGLQKIVGTDTSYNGLVDVYNIVLPEAGSITVGEAAPPVVNATQATTQVGEEYSNWGYKATMAYDNTKTGVKFTVTTDDASKTNKTVTKEFAFTTFNVVSVENAADITVGLNITNVPTGVTLSGVTAQLY